MFLRSLSKFHRCPYLCFYRLYFLSFGQLETYSTIGQQRNLKCGSHLSCYRSRTCVCSEGRWNKGWWEHWHPGTVYRASVLATQLWAFSWTQRIPSVWEVSLPRWCPTCRLTVGHMPLRIRADTCWHGSLEHFFNLMAEQDFRWRDEETGKKMQWTGWIQASARESRSCLEQASDGVCHGGRSAAGSGASLSLSGLASPWQGFWKTRHPKTDTFPHIPLLPCL